MKQERLGPQDKDWSKRLQRRGITWLLTVIPVIITYVCSKCHKAKLPPTFQSSPARRSPLSSTNSPLPPLSRLRHSAVCLPVFSVTLFSFQNSLQLLVVPPNSGHPLRTHASLLLPKAFTAHPSLNCGPGLSPSSSLINLIILSSSIPKCV